MTTECRRKSQKRKCRKRMNMICLRCQVKRKINVGRLVDQVEEQGGSESRTGRNR